MASTFKVIKPTRRINNLSIRNGLSRAAEATRVNLLRNFRRTTKTWQVKAQFSATIRGTAFRYIITVGTNDELYAEINFGTKFMTDVLSRNFVPKTRPGVLDSFPGRGGRLFRGGSPGPGIIPRRWDIAAAKEEERLMVAHLQNVIDRFAQQSGHQR